MINNHRMSLQNIKIRMGHPAVREQACDRLLEVPRKRTTQRLGEIGEGGGFGFEGGDGFYEAGDGEGVADAAGAADEAKDAAFAS
jgi:hypothetical protein